MAKRNYNFFLVAVVGTVALLSLFLIVATFNPEGFLGRNLHGQASNIVYDGTSYDVVVLAEGDAIIEGNVELILRIATPAFVLFDWTPAVGTTPLAPQQLSLGDSVLLEDVTITLYESTTGEAGLVFAPATQACGTVDEQTAVCRGSSACCGGVCTELPGCLKVPDGPVLTCGSRQLYCCSNELTFEQCGGGS